LRGGVGSVVRRALEPRQCALRIAGIQLQDAKRFCRSGRIGRHGQDFFQAAARLIDVSCPPEELGQICRGGHLVQ
jgi:hypothetical protein